MADNKTELTTIIHGQFRDKNNDTNKYDILYPENSTDDVLIGIGLMEKRINDITGKSHLVGSYENLSKLFIELIKRLNNSGPINVRGICENLETENKIYPRDTYIYETDTNKMRLADGITPYIDLDYLTIIPPE